MSTSGRGGDALTRAAHIRATTAGQARNSPGADYEALQDDALLTRISLDADDHQLAARMVRRLANRHGCRPQSDPGHCPDPVAHTRDVAAIGPAWAALGLAGTGARDERKDGYGLLRSSHRGKPKPGGPAA